MRSAQQDQGHRKVLLVTKGGKYHNYLRVSNHTDDLAVTQHLTEIVLDALLAEIIGPLLAGLGECLLLALVPD